MTSFCHQLKLLLWKNYILRKRHKVRIVLELIWPLILFLILMWVRTRGLLIPHSACHLIEKSLPSVGGFPFLQNFICTLNNTCYDEIQTNWKTEYVEDIGGRDAWKNASLPKMVKEMSPILEEIVANPKGVDTLSHLMSDFRKLTNPLIAESIRNELREIGEVKLRSFLSDPNGIEFLKEAKTYGNPLTIENFSEILDTNINLGVFSKTAYDKVESEIFGPSKGNCDKLGNYKLISINETVFDNICALKNDVRNFLRVVFEQEMNKTGRIYKKMVKLYDAESRDGQGSVNLKSFAKYDRKTLQNLGKIGSILRIFWNASSLMMTNDMEVDKGGLGTSVGAALAYKALCGIELSQNSSLLGVGNEGTNSYDTLRDRLRNWRNRRPYHFDPEVSSVCNVIFEQLESRPLTNVLWRQVKPFIRGRLLYYPRTTFTESLMNRFDEKFSKLEELERALNSALNILHRVRSSFLDNEENIKALQNALKDEKSDITVKINSYLTLMSVMPMSPLLPSHLMDPERIQEMLTDFKEFDFSATDALLERIDFSSEVESEVMNCIRYNKSTSYNSDPRKYERVDFASEDEAVTDGLRLMLDNNLWAVIIFMNVPEDGSPPQHLKYKIRMDSDKVDGTRQIRDRLTRKSPRRRPNIDIKYITNGFVYIQEMIERSFVEQITGNSLTDISSVLQQFPFPCYIFDQFIKAISSTFPLFMVLSWVYASAMLIKSIVLEKELRLKEVMKVMGCGNSVIWTAWFIDSFAVMSMSCLILALILKYGHVIENSDFTVILMFLIIFAISTICFSFLVSTFFTRANSAAAIGGILFFVTHLPYNFMLIWEDRLTWYHTMASCLFSNVAFGFGCTYIARLEEDGLGARWDRISIRTLPDDDFNFIYCLLMLVFDSILYLTLALYIEGVFPGDNGMPRKWYFPVQYTFWFPKAIPKNGIGVLDYERYSDPSNKPIVEKEPEGLQCGVSILHLCKKYNNGYVALSDLNLSFYENQITSFLGHNGAGKTTTISILTGLFPPSEGTALIYNRDIRTDIDIIRHDLGICPQHNVLFDRLTVAEHMLFYADLKGKVDIVKEEMNQILFDLGIPHKKDEFPSNLSGGMKRKLSVAIAFVGGSRTVFLDEPTSGVDPYSRRSIWELLLKYKAGRTIILTTHFMDEADILGDRIAIISQGKLKACGTSLFLKAQFGQGYFIRLVREIEESPAEELIMNNIPPSTIAGKVSGATKSSLYVSHLSKSSIISTRHTELFMNFIKRRIPEAKLVSDIGSDVVFLLPSNKVNEYELLFQDLDDNMGNLRIQSYGISDTTLEDVFLQITVEDLEQAAKEGDHKDRTCLGYCYTRRLWSAVWKMRHSIKRKRRRKSYHSVTIPIPSADEQRLSATKSLEPIAEPEIQDSEVELPPDIDAVGDEQNEFQQGSPKSISSTTPLHQLRRHSTAEVEFHEPDSSETETEAEEIVQPTSRGGSLFVTKRENIKAKYWIQIWVIILKRFRNSNRNKKAIFFEVIVPVLFIALMLACTLVLPAPADETPREITYNVYKPSNNIFFSLPDKPAKSLTDTVSELTGELGIGTSCLMDRREEGNCEGKSWSKTAAEQFRQQGNLTGSLGTCSCASGSQMCSANIEKPPPPKLITRTEDYILDVSMYDVPEWVIKTYYQYDRKRYGGYETLMREPEDYTVSEFISLLDKFTTLTEGKKRIPLSEKPFYKMWFENRGWLSSTAYLNGLHNMILRQNLPSSEETVKERYGITLFTHPMNLTTEQQKKESLKTAALGVIHAICVIFALSFVPASFTVYLIEERKSGAKHLHLISGVKPITYWISNFSFDMVKYVISAMLCVLLFCAFDAKAYIAKDSVASFIALLLLYGWASIPLMYPASYIFSIPSTAFVALACFNLFVGIVTTVSTFVLDQFGDEELKEISDILQQVFLIFPHYCLGRGLMELVKLHMAATAFGKLNIDDFYTNRFQWKVMGKLLACLAVQGFLFFIFTISLEYKQWVYLLLCKKKLLNKKNRVHQALLDKEEDEDEDVQKEIYRVTHNPPENASLVAENLAKIYSGKKRPAVNNLCFAVEPGECFGLLGVNGAGKSTTFKMLTGDVRITSGKASIMGFDVEKSLDSAREHYGYCPQDDGIDPLLNAYEQLELYGKLRGLSYTDVQATASRLISSLGLTRYAKRRCGTYSGGNKRKISTAIALIGNPDVVFLDEPTSGMDPGARRQLWKLIIAITRMGKSVILTTHSMEECEALCSRLAIMVNGKFMCLGSLQHLKNRFGKGYTLSVRCPEPKQTNFLRSLEDSLPFAKLEDLHCSQLKFNIPQEEVRLRDIFSVMCTARMDELIEDFSVSQTTLDDIFIKFANEQRDELDRRPTGAAARSSIIITSET